jgi:hypothetical protein
MDARALMFFCTAAKAIVRTGLWRWLKTSSARGMHPIRE